MFPTWVPQPDRLGNGAAGLPTCDLLVALDNQEIGNAANGSVVFSRPVIPAGLLGLELHLQAATFPKQGGPAIALSNALRLFLGN